jgi:23S rRNA pseudouridine2605 synthase
MDFVMKQERLFPVGRLDRNTTGVLLMTNDGELAYRLTHPKYQIERVYDVGLDKRLSVAHAKQIADGVELEDGFTGPCEVFMDLKDNTKAAIILHEGKNREVRRIFEHLNYEVRKLERKEFAGLNVKGLTRGEYRHLTRQELLALRALVKLK